jgi:predicted  nucleic acid-binding Zn-ribbon protein
MNDHIGEANEMSDTLRTDAEAFYPHDSKWKVCDADFARQLERELNAANDRIKRLEEENNELRAEEARLLNTNGELERRIKRLEEAGNDLHDGWRGNRNNKDKYFEAWRKAKEVK